jgi:phosphonate degradation associated HDIG domain protein
MGLAFDDLGTIFRRHGDIEYSGEGVTQLEHALQSALAAESAGATPELVTAALLHDLGHMLNLQGETPSERGIDDQHQYFAIPFLRPLFGAAVLDPIRFHVDAKRALCAVEPGYHDALSEDSKRSLKLQGGVFSPAQVDEFMAKPFARDAMQLRRWDDQAKVPGLATPVLEHYLDIAARCRLVPA